jgi:hypothetical protein
MIIHLLAIAISYVEQPTGNVPLPVISPATLNHAAFVAHLKGCLLCFFIRENMTDKQVDYVAMTHHAPLIGGFTIAAGSFYTVDYRDLGISILFRLDSKGQYRVYKIFPALELLDKGASVSKGG